MSFGGYNIQDHEMQIWVYTVEALQMFLTL